MCVRSTLISGSQKNTIKVRREDNLIASLQAELKASQMRSDFFSEQLVRVSDEYRAQIKKLEKHIKNLTKEQENG